MTEFWIVRHTAVAVAAGTCYGRSDVPLRESFAEEAAAVARQLQGERFDEVWSSPLSRCTRLAAFCGYADARRDDRLRELDFGTWEMQRFDAIRDPQLQRWYDDWIHERPTGGESFDDQCRRVGSFLEEVSNNQQQTTGRKEAFSEKLSNNRQETAGREGAFPEELPNNQQDTTGRKKAFPEELPDNQQETAGRKEAFSEEISNNQQDTAGRKEAEDCPRRVLVFAHGGVQLAAGVYAGRFSAGEAFAHQLEYGGIFKVRI